MSRRPSPAPRLAPGGIPLDRLGFDIDGVVADIMTTFLDMAQERYGPHPFSYDDITTFYLEDCLGFDPSVVAALIRELIDRPHELAVEPFPQAVPVLSRLAEEAPLVFVTARDRPGPIQLWLNRTLAPVPSRSIWVMATGDPDTKLHYLRAHAIQYFVEDRLETCFDLAQAGITPIVFAQPWNRKPHPFLEVAGWPELARLLFEDNGGGG
jgi:uncharacterized HAD superfamily protein